MRALITSLLLLLICPPALAGAADKRLDIYWIDVEGGASTLIVTPAGESVLIDTGNAGGRDPQRIFDAASKVAGLKQIDNLVITHYHGDHFGGAAELAQLMPIRNVYDNGNFASGHERPSQAYLDFKAAKRLILDPGDEIPLQQTEDAAAPQVHLRCLAARQRRIEPPPGATENPLCKEPTHKPRDLSDNANSIVQLLSFGDFRLFDGGDLTWNLELKLVCPINLVGVVDVYQAEHHGLDQSNHPLLIQSLAPTVAIINNGPRKGCEPNMFAALKAQPTVQAIYQLHRNLRPDGNVNNVADAAYIANEKDPCDGNYVKLSVDPAAKTYTVSIRATHHERTYSVRSKEK
jgi:beta-lactamase superfamily II metal-dependent hydrolase